MKLYPAVDIRKGRCVRLFRGDFSTETVFSQDPVAMARHWRQMGAQMIHVVDLDGAQTGNPENARLIEAMAGQGLPLQVGGGIRTYERAAEFMQVGVKRVVLGTVAAREPDLLKRLVEAYEGRIVVAVDCRGGQLSVEGWQRQTSVAAVEFCYELRRAGIDRVLVTDIDRDGMLRGPNLALVREVLDTGMCVIASGGVGSVEDLVRLRELAVDQPRLEGIVVGRALYDGTIPVEHVLTYLSDGRRGEPDAGEADHSLS